MNIVYRLSIVGGGSVAVSFLGQLIAHIQDAQARRLGLQITIFEPTGKMGRGTAYQDDLNTSLLNVPANNMSLYDKNRAHFLEWVASLSDQALQQYGVSEINGYEFYPRALFGRYVQEQFDCIVAQANALGANIEVVQDAVAAIEYQNGSQIRLQASSGRWYESDRVVLCNGNLSSDKFDILESCDNFFNSPYPVRDVLQKIPSQATVGILGSNLSAIDAIVALGSRGHTGQIHCFSRQGKLPSVRSNHVTSVSKRLTRNEVLELVVQNGGALTLKVIAEKLQQMILSLDASADPGDMMGCGNDAREQLSREIEASLSGERPWQAVLASTNDVIDLLWFYLSPGEKQQFQRQWLSRWMSRRAMFPVKNALKLQTLLKAGQLHIHGRFKSCHPIAQSRRFDMVCSYETDNLRSLQCDFIINATGFSQDINRSNDPLIVNLLKTGTAVASEYGGFKLDFQTGSLVMSGGDIADRMTVLGSLARGTYFWTISMDVNARLANEQARQIVHSIVQEREMVAPERLS